MDDTRDLNPEVGQLLDDLCTRLGICLPPDAQRQLMRSPLTDADAFTDAVLAAEGLDPHTNKDLRRRVRDFVSLRRRPSPDL